MVKGEKETPREVALEKSVWKEDEGGHRRREERDKKERERERGEGSE